MRLPVPRPPRQPAPLNASTYSRLTAELASVVAAARRRALRDGDRQIDTAHLLHSLMEEDAGARAVFDGTGQAARVLGYLVQRSIGYGLRWQGSVEDSGAIAVLRDVEAAGWSPSASAALEVALERAARRGEARATGLDLLAAIAADRDCRAVDVLRRAGIDTGLLDVRIAELSQQASRP
ncbi:Clp protease N-terminal domain-containing protein [Streptomyces sp. NPDC059828]|uniref:Clp protease N-terminal domain-containing protein n=1 Tax=Streptomyces sp. NPDC059828 TaxID=3346965 RepID=UPI0036679C53